MCQCTNGSVALASYNKGVDLDSVPHSHSRDNTPMPVRHSAKKKKRLGMPFLVFLRLFFMVSSSTWVVNLHFSDLISEWWKEIRVECWAGFRLAVKL